MRKIPSSTPGSRLAASMRRPNADRLAEGGRKQKTALAGGLETPDECGLAAGIS